MMASPYVGQWDELQGGGIVQRNLYTDIFYNNYPLKFAGKLFLLRSRFAYQIEEQDWHLIDPDDYLLGWPLAETAWKNIESAIRQTYDHTPKDQLEERIRLMDLIDEFKNNPNNFARYIKSILEQEQVILHNSQNGLKTEALNEEKIKQEIEDKIKTRKTEINNEIVICKNNIRETKNQLDLAQENIEHIRIVKNEIDEYNFHIQTGQVFSPREQYELHDRKVKETEFTWNELQKNLFGILQWQSDTAQRSDKLVQQIVLEETNTFERSKAAEYNGAPILYMDLKGSQLDYWFKEISDIVWNSLQQISNVEQCADQSGLKYENLLSIKNSFVHLLQTIVENGLVIEKHPPQVLIKEKKFVAHLRHLVADKFDIHKVTFEVTAHLTSESSAKQIYCSPIIVDDGSIINGRATSKYNEQTEQIEIDFRNVQLSRSQKSRPGGEMVTESKFGILFEGKVNVHSPVGNFTFHARRLSLPCVVITHGKQVENAQPTVLWDNAFAEQGRIPFEVTPSVPWGQVIQALDNKWKKECNTQRGLSLRARNTLCCKAYGQVVSDDTIFERHMLNKTNLSHRQFTLWHWFYTAMDLIKSLGGNKNYISKA